MTALDKLKRSNAWDTRYNLPTVPEHNNPWIYMAYAYLLLKLNGERRAWKLMAEQLEYFYQACTLERGLIDRWPDGSGGSTSHDELIGAAYLVPGFAADCLRNLKNNSGFYDNTEEPLGIFRTQYRFIFLVPFLKACTMSDEKPQLPNFFEKLLWCTHLIAQSFEKELDYGGILKSWLMADVMESFFMCRLAIAFWTYRLTKRNVTGVKMFFQHYLTEAPVFQDLAPWDLR